MILNILALLLGLALIIYGADWLVGGASGVARKAGLSEFVIGLTIVGFGTSCPELVVSLTGAFAGNSDISIGNVVGSNIFNTLIILGVTSVVAPVLLTKANLSRDIPVNILITLLLIGFGMSATIFGLGSADGISRLEGLLLVAVFAAYIIWCFRSGSDDESPEEKQASLPVSRCILLIIAGLAGLIGGGQLFVNSATSIAHSLNISDKFVAITILAGGTSLPELATCVMAAAKKKGQLALGNIIGSNIFNILFILGCSALVHPINMEGMNMVDMGVLLAGAVLVCIASWTGRKVQINRLEGSIMLLCGVGYMTWLCMNI